MVRSEPLAKQSATTLLWMMILCPVEPTIQRGGNREVVPDQHSPRPNRIRAMHESLSREMTGTARRRRTPMCVRDRGRDGGTPLDSPLKRDEGRDAP